MAVTLQPPERRVDRPVGDVRQPDSVHPLDELVPVRLPLVDQVEKDEPEHALEDLAVMRRRLHALILTKVPVYAK